MYSRLFATAFYQFGNGPMAAFDASGHGWRHSQGAVRLAEVVIREIERDRSLKVMIQSGCPLDDHTVPDGSVGTVWGNYWAENKMDQTHGPRLKHPHNYPDWFPQSAANPIPAWIYPAKALGDFRVWLYEHYVKTSFPKYLDDKVKKGVFLPSRAELLLEAVSRKELGVLPKTVFMEGRAMRVPLTHSKTKRISDSHSSPFH